MVDAVSSRGGSNIGNIPNNCHSPSPSLTASPRDRKPRRANSVVLSLYILSSSLEQEQRFRIALGAPLAAMNFSPSFVTSAVIRLETGSKGVNFSVFQFWLRISLAFG